MGYIKGIDRNQIMLFPESIDEYVKADNNVRVIDAFVESLDITKIGFRKSADEGRPGYDPKDLCKLYIYGYYNKIRSSRKLMTECHRNIEVMWLLRKVYPDFRTIADFRKNNVDAIKNVFREYTKFCCKIGLIKGDLIAIDGSKFLAVNSKERCFTIDSVKDKIEKLNTSVTEYMNKMDINDFEEKNESEYTKKDLQERIEHLEQKKTIYEGYLYQMEQTGETQIALTDSESRIMKTRHGKNACLNVQTAVDAENHLITNFVVTNQCNDFGMLASTMTETKELLEAESIETIADKGYRSDEDVLKCLLNGDIPNVYPRDGKDCYTFAFEEQKEEINEAEKESCKKEDIEKCLHAGILPDILKNKPVMLTPQNISVREEMFVRKDTGEIVSPETASIKEDNSTHAKNEYIFVRNLETDTVTCPQGQILHFLTLSHKKESYTHNRCYCNPKACASCPQKCTASKYRSITFKDGEIRKKAKSKTTVTKVLDGYRSMRVKEVKKKFFLRFYPNMEKLNLRKQIVEHPFGTIKRWCDGSYLLLKGRYKATADLSFSFLSYNLKRTINIIGTQKLLELL